MEKPEEPLARRIENGDYFRDARDWYSQIYIAPISQRIFLIVVSVVAALVFLMALIGISNLMPLAPRVPFIYTTTDSVNQFAQIHRFKKPGESPNPALVRFYLKTYLEAYEGYTEQKFITRRQLIQSYSDPEVFKKYNYQTHPNNPESPIRKYGKFGQARVHIGDIRVNMEQKPYVAQADFSTEVDSGGGKSSSHWTATIRFEYTSLVERDTYDEKAGEYVLDFDEPTFKVLDYNVRERLATGAR